MRKIFTRKRPIVIFYQRGQDVLWYRNAPDESGAHGSLAEGIPHLAKHEILLLIPVQRLMLAKVSLRNARDEALKWQLEPLVTQGIDDLHTARLETNGDEHLMAVTDAAWFKQMLDEMRDSDIIPDRVLPDVMAITPGERWRTQDGWLLRLKDGTGLHLTSDELASFPDLISLRESKTDLIQAILDGECVLKGNMLQGSFEVKKNLRLPVATLVCSGFFFIATLTGTPLIQGLKAERSFDALNKQVLNRYQQYFPDETPAAPLRQFSRKLAQIDEVYPASSLLVILQENSRMLNSLVNNPLRELEWDKEDGRLVLIFRDALPTHLNPAAATGFAISIDHTQLIVSKEP